MRNTISKLLAVFVIAALVLGGMPVERARAATPVFINEIHYDNTSTDANEAIEIAGPAGTDLTGWTVVFYNGNTPTAAITYGTLNLSGVIPNQQDGFGTLDFAFAGIQNGPSDGMVLVNASSSVVQFLSYEGAITASNGPAAGMTSVNIGVSEAGTEALGLSLQLVGTGASYENFTWSGPIAHTRGAVNTGQTFTGSETAPAVSSTTPADNATGVPVADNLTVVFNEPVTPTAPWVTLSCDSSPVTLNISGGPTTWTLDPASDLPEGASCTLTVVASQIADVDTIDPPSVMVADYVADFTTFDGCAAPFTPIYTIQGNGSATPIPGTVTTKGVVVGDFEGSSGQQGFYLQDLAGDSDTTTSDGIFVYTGSTNLVSAGQVVYVTGYARERYNQTTINGSDSDSAAVPSANIAVCGAGSVTPVDVTMPFASATDPERFEGMLVRFPQNLVIAEYFNYDRYGEMVIALPLAGETRPFTGTSIDEPGVDANARTLANSLRRITLDDGLSTQNPSTLRHPNGSAFSLSNLFRGGDIVKNTVGVLGYDFSIYRIQPTTAAEYTPVNPRTAAPEAVDGSLRIAAMNTLNFFLTADYPTGNPLDNKCGPLQNVECRGWDSDQAQELTRQRTKIVAAIAGLNADIVGLNELENTAGVDPLGGPNGIVEGLNALLGPGTYAYINTGIIGTDAIRVGIIYKPANVTPVGGFQILDSTDDPRFIDTRNRPTLAQTFEEKDTGGIVTVAVNHFKSKGSACTGDPDLGDGQGNCNVTRTEAARALVDWLATDPTGSGDPDFIIMGDLNSYAQEDPIDAIKLGPDDTAATADDYTNLISLFQGVYAYSYTYDGQAGYLDHALANSSLLGQVTGAADWHINSDEPDVLDYDTSFKPAAQDALYETNATRSSDHDPVVVGLNLQVDEVYIASDGDCNSNSPCFSTIEEGLVHVKPDGGIVHIYGNVYSEDLPILTNLTVIGEEDFSVRSYTQTDGHLYAPANLSVSGNFTALGGSFHHNNGAVHLNGVEQTIFSYSSFFDIFTEMSVDGFVRMASNLHVLNTMHMDRGVWLMGAFYIVMDTNATFTGGDSNSFIYAYNGQLRKMINTANPPAITFPVGDYLDGSWDYSPATLDLYNVVGTGYISVRIRPNPNTHNTLLPRLNRFWVLEQVGLTSFNWDGTFTYVDSDVEGTESNLYAAKYSAIPLAHWDVSGPADTVNNTLTFTGASGFSEVTGTPQTPNSPTAVEMAEMLAVSGPGAVSLSWQTEAEASTTGFRIYRSASPDGQRTLLTAMIPAEGGLEGASYSYIDFSAMPGQTWYYWIEAISDDAIQTYGPLVVTVKPPLYLPAIFFK